MMRRAWAIAGSGLAWLALVLATSPRLVLASHWIAGRKSWEFPWYSVAMMMVVPYIVLALLGLAVYRAARSR